MSHSAKAKMIFLHALTPVHSGTGQAVAVVDLPVAREKATGFPIIPASSLKGVLRDALSDGAPDGWVEKVFGKDVREGGDMTAGTLCFTDQRILCLPVRSYFGTFAYVTCPLVLSRFVRDTSAFGLTPLFDAVPEVMDSGDTLHALVPNGSEVVKGGNLYLEDLDISAKPDQGAEAVAKALAQVLFPDSPDTLVKRFVVVSNEVFNFLSETALEVSARVRLKDDTKTVAQGALWYEEAVPAESIFHGVVMVADFFRGDVQSLWQTFTPSLVQIGGNSSVGRGLCRVVVK